MDDIDFQLDRPRVLFSDFFQIAPEALEAYGTFNISLVGDLPLFIDPFLLFNSEKPEYQVLHEGIIQYLKFLRDKSLDHEVTEGELKAWYFFKEIEQNWFGFSKTGNKGSALGREFAEALNNGFRLIFSEYGQEQVTKSSHLEKLCLIAEGVGRDRISSYEVGVIPLCCTQTWRRPSHLPSDNIRPDPTQRCRPKPLPSRVGIAVRSPVEPLPLAYAQ